MIRQQRSRHGVGVAVSALLCAVACREPGATKQTPSATVSSAPVASSAVAETQEIPPPGWLPWKDWSADCPLYYPASADHLPPPIEWKPCGKAPPGVACRVMATDWTDQPRATMSYYPKFSAGDGKPMILLRRVTPRSWLEIVAEVDGPVRNAVLRIKAPGDSPAKAGCMTQLEDLDEGRWALRIRGHDANGDSSKSPHSGGIGGVVGMREPTVIARAADSRVYSFQVSATRLARVGVPGSAVSTSLWSRPSDKQVTSPADDPEGLKAGQVALSGDTLFWSTATATVHGINVWTPKAGAQPFVRFVGDSTRGAADLGTDGKHLVWSQGEGKKPKEPVYPKRSVMTAPFTSNPTAVKPRRLRSAPYENIGSQQWVVGCGFAAHSARGNDLVIVRLPDGQAWFVEQQLPDFALFSPLGLTCEEAFFVGRFGGRLSIARLRLDSLGDGVAAD